jgi:hypothetical protein
MIKRLEKKQSKLNRTRGASFLIKIMEETQVKYYKIVAVAALTPPPL